MFVEAEVPRRAEGLPVVGGHDDPVSAVHPRSEVGFEGVPDAVDRRPVGHLGARGVDPASGLGNLDRLDRVVRSLGVPRAEVLASEVPRAVQCGDVGPVRLLEMGDDPSGAVREEVVDTVQHRLRKDRLSRVVPVALPIGLDRGGAEVDVVVLRVRGDDMGVLEHPGVRDAPQPLRRTARWRRRGGNRPFGHTTQDVGTTGVQDDEEVPVDGVESLELITRPPARELLYGPLPGPVDERLFHEDPF